MTDQPSRSAVHCEVVKLAMNQTRDGYKLVLAVHPNEVPEELLRSFVGTRYMMALAELDDRDQPKPLPEREPKDPGKEAVTYAALLCKEPAFQRYMYRQGYASAPTEESATSALRVVLRVESRAELATNEAARKELYSIAEAYLHERGSP